jgi:peptide/nickel transport system ATP-binding protein
LSDNESAPNRTPPTRTQALTAERVTVSLVRGGTPIVDDLSFELQRGELLALVGESGSGKTTAALSLLAFTRPGAAISEGSIVIDGKPLLERSDRDLCQLRGRVVTYVPQNPSSALNPAIRIGAQVAEALEIHDLPADEARVAELFERVSLPADRAFRQRFPHQVSGGQQQRVVIAMALACSPALVVLDEPTTALDVITQAHVLALIRDLRDSAVSAFLYVTHDLAVVASLATRVGVMYAGRVIEEGPLDAVLTKPRHPYTQRLVASIPKLSPGHVLTGIPGVAPAPTERPAGCSFAARCEHKRPVCEKTVPDREFVTTGHHVRCFRWREIGAETVLISTRQRAAKGEVLLDVAHLYAAYRHGGAVLRDVSLTIRKGECLAVVGRSGSGKTTLARCIVGLHPPTAGSIRLATAPLAAAVQHRQPDERRRIQIVFQNPDDSLNPRQPIRDIVARPVIQLKSVERGEALNTAEDLLERVRLPRGLGDRYPYELSGGERQRVSIARALAAEPELVICDEITSALDVSVQAAILALLDDLRDELGLSLLFISHDLAVVAAVADSIVVLDQGEICEAGKTAKILQTPTHPTTRALLESAPETALATLT